MTRLILFGFLFFWHLLAWAQKPTLLLEQAFLKDPQAQLTLEQVARASFQPYEGHLGLGFQPGAVWIRLKVGKAEPEGGDSSAKRVIRVGPNFLEQIELFTVVNGRWQRQLRGAQMPEASRACPDDMHCFAMQALPDEASTVYLRIAHRGFLVAQVEVLSLDALPAAVAKRIRGITVSMVVALGLWAVGMVLLLTDRSLLLLAYCCFQLTVAFFIASNAGLLAVIFPALPGEFLNLFNALLYVLRVTVTGFLAWAVLRPHQPSQGYLQGAKVMLVLCGVNGLLVLSGQVQLGLLGSLLVISAIPLWQLYGTWSARALPTFQRRILLAGSCGFILLVILGLWLNFTERPMLPQMGFIRQVVDWRLNGFAVGVLFFWITMLERSSQKRARKQEMESLRHHALEARARQAELDERTALTDMLTHELKNPLGTIRFALASLRQTVANPDSLQRIQSIDLSARRMDDLIERVAHFSKIERAVPTQAVTEMDVAALLQEVLPEVPGPEQWDIQVQPGASFRGDRQLLWVILENLMSNASKYSLPGHPICIRVSLEEDARQGPAPAPDQAAPSRMTRLEISNHVDAASVPEEASLFDRYYRHPNVQNQAGMGLGLSVVKSAVQKIRGEVSYRYAQGQVCFTLRAPA